MIQTKGYATQDKSAKFAEFNFERRDVGRVGGGNVGKARENIEQLFIERGLA